MAVATGTAILAAGATAAVAGVYGANKQADAAKDAAAANAAQQAKALEFQELQIQRSIAALDEGFKFAEGATRAAYRRSMGDIGAALEARGLDPVGTFGLGLKRAATADTTFALQQLYNQQAAQKAAAYTGQSFPMLTQQGPQGNWGADYANLVAGIGNAYAQASYMDQMLALQKQQAMTAPLSTGQTFNDLNMGTFPGSDLPQVT